MYVLKWANVNSTVHGQKANQFDIFCIHAMQERKTTYHIRSGGPNFGASTAMTKQNIMSAILKTKGPAVTHRVVNCSYTFLRMLTAKQFMTVASELESIGLGTIVSLKSAGRPTYLYLKHPPENVRGILEANPDLCSLGYYTSRYEMPISKIMSPSIREALRSMGLIEQVARPIDFSNSNRGLQQDEEVLDE